MSDKVKIALIYTVVALVGIVVVGLASFARKGVDKRGEMRVNKVEETEARVYTTLTKPIEFKNQSGESVTLDDLRGKVWIFVQFYASCPQCAKRNYLELQNIHDTYKNHPDFRLVCVTVNPDRDTVQMMNDYAEALKAPKESWYFLTGKPAEIMPYMVEEFKYPTVKKLSDEAEIAEKGEFAHDLSLAVFDRDLQMRGKYDLFSNRDANPEVYELMKAKMGDQLKEYLGK